MWLPLGPGAAGRGVPTRFRRRHPAADLGRPFAESLTSDPDVIVRARVGLAGAELRSREGGLLPAHAAVAPRFALRSRASGEPLRPLPRLLSLSGEGVCRQGGSCTRGVVVTSARAAPSSRWGGRGGLTPALVEDTLKVL